MTCGSVLQASFPTEIKYDGLDKIKLLHFSKIGDTPSGPGRLLASRDDNPS